MKRHKLNSRWPIVVVLALTIGWGYWGLAGGCAPTGDENGTEELEISKATCKQLDAEESGFDIRLRAVSKEGRELSYTRRLTLAADRGAGFQTETEVTADGELVMSIVATADGEGAEVQIEYGPLVPGMSSASAVVEDGVVSGTVDGRDMVPMPVDEADPSAVSFEDGDPAPEHGMDPDLEAAVTQLFQAVATTAEGCSVPNGNGNDVAKVMSRGHKNTGHYSDTGLLESGDCNECWLWCGVETGICVAGVSGGCWLALFGAPACYVAGYLECAFNEVACMADCYSDGGGCCPKSCGGPGTCCFSDETCLNTEYGLCCGPGETACYERFCCEGTEVCMQYDAEIVGPNCCEPENICGHTVAQKTCCNPTDTCIPDYHVCCPAGHPPCFDHCCDTGQECVNNNMVCCDVGNICNDRCCTDDEVCHAGVCCQPHLVCGSVCCDELDSGCIPELSLCCGFDQDPCGDTCCALGESCVTGTTCCPDARICGDVCCPEGHGCDPQTTECTPCPNPTDHPCDEGGCCPADKFCSGVEGICCDWGEICCDAVCAEGCQHPTYCLD